MCGIAGGVWSAQATGLSLDQLRAMTDSILHRGPDDEGLWLSPPSQQANFLANPTWNSGVALGFRRLAIIDLDTGRQPMSNEDQSIRLVFNGEIYNYRELRHRLEASGHRFASQSDTETIVHLYEDLGTDCFKHFNGMFAIAIWDSTKDRLILARDRLGKKPLFYWHDTDRLFFASELKALRRVSGFPQEIDYNAIDAYLTYQYIPHPMTIYKGVHKLPPGHFLILENGRLEIQPYWDIDWSHEAPMSLQQAKSELRQRLTAAVERRLRSDVPLGAFLSGGIDSSLVCAIAQKMLQTPLRTFAIGFSEADFDETQYAASVAKHLGTEHQRFEVQPDAVGILDALVDHYDEPFSDSSAVPTWYLCELTRKSVTVALSGDGGDELFGGYDRYRALQLSEKLQNWLPVGWLSRSKLIRSLPDSNARRSLLRRIRRFCEALGQPAPQRYMNWIQGFSEAARIQLFQDSFIESLPDQDPFTFLNQAWSKANPKKRDPMSCAMAADLQTYVPCDLMTKVDMASMRHSLEARQPFLDYTLVEWAMSLPLHLKMHRGQGKWLLRETFKDDLPAEIWTRPKMGFGIPIAKWFRTSLKERTIDALLGSDARCHRFFRPEAVRQLVDQHMQGRVNQCYRLWNLLVLELWLRKQG
jgi:asparagine synthase (glutamine-hydrolysing)